MFANVVIVLLYHMIRYDKCIDYREYLLTYSHLVSRSLDQLQSCIGFITDITVTFTEFAVDLK